MNCTKLFIQWLQLGRRRVWAKLKRKVGAYITASVPFTCVSSDRIPVYAAQTLVTLNYNYLTP